MQKLIKAIVWIGGVGLGVGLILRLTLFKSWKVPDDPVLAASLAPTLAGGDSVLVLTRGTRSFGELVRCPDPENPTRWVVGRIAGVAGDVVEVRGPELKVNGQRYEGKSACSQTRMKVPHPSSESEVEIACDIVEMGGGWHYRGSATAGQQITETKVTVSPGKVFLVSDNRVYHDDSQDFGVLDEASCKERIWFRLTSKDGWKDDKNRMTFIH